MSAAKTFYVYMTCKVRKQVTCECETEEQAYEEPWEFATDEIEIDQVDWEVDEVKEA